METAREAGREAAERTEERGPDRQGADGEEKLRGEDLDHASRATHGEETAHEAAQGGGGGKGEKIIDDSGRDHAPEIDRGR